MGLVRDTVLPDVAMLGDPWTGYLTGMTDPTSHIYGEGGVGGTSLATPLFAATMVLAQQRVGRTFGFADPLLYAASKKHGFTDIAPATAKAVAVIPGGTAATFDFHGSGNTNVSAVGFDATTGLGVPNRAAFFTALK